MILRRAQVDSLLISQLHCASHLLVRFGIRKAMYNRLLRSAKVAKHPVLFPREETIVPNSQCLNSCLLLTDLGRLERLPILNLPRVS